MGPLDATSNFQRGTGRQEATEDGPKLLKSELVQVARVVTVESDAYITRIL